MSRRTSRGLTLTDKGRAAIGVAETVEVPLLTDAGILARFRPPTRRGGVSGDLPPAPCGFLRSDVSDGYNVTSPDAPIGGKSP